ERLRAALDADADVATSLADRSDFVAAMQGVASDHIASAWVDLARLAGLGSGRLLGGYGSPAVAVTAEANGLHLGGTASFDAGRASAEARAAFRQGTKRSSLAAWMPRTTSAELGLFGLAHSFADLEASLGGDAAFRSAADALNELLGLNADDVAAALEAHAAGTTLSRDDRYRSPFELARGRAGNETWADVASLTDGLTAIFDPGSDVRDILHQIGELAISASANDD